jgi:hypothetical protein
MNIHIRSEFERYSITVWIGDKKIFSAADADCESQDATTACQLLQALHDSKVIDLTACELTKNQFDFLKI